MNVRRIGRGAWTSSALTLALALTLNGWALGGPKEIQAPRLVPLESVDPALRSTISEVLAEPTLHHRGASDTFPCPPKLYQSLMNEPMLTLALWKDLAASPARLSQASPTRYEGTDGAGTTASWEYALRSPRLNVMFSNLEHNSPRGNATLKGRIVLVVRSEYYREPKGDYWIRHDVEAFVKIDSRGWKAVARTLRPLLEKLLEDQVQEAGLFVSLMARLVVQYPTWASGVCMAQQDVPMPSRVNLRDLVILSRRPDAVNGRPQMAQTAPTATARR